MSQPHPTPLSKRQSQCDGAERCACAVKSSSMTSTSYVSTRFLAIICYFTRICHVKLPSKNLSQSFPQWQRLSALLRTAANGCERLRSLRQRVASKALYIFPQTPRVKRKPFIWEKRRPSSYLKAPASHGPPVEIHIGEQLSSIFSKLRGQSSFCAPVFLNTNVQALGVNLARG